MSGWRKLEEPEYTHIWDYVYDGLGFHPSTAFSHWPGFREPIPSVTFKMPEQWTDDDLDDLYDQFWSALRAVTEPGKELYALDWQHECFAYEPSVVIEPESRHPWSRGVFPDGDYAITLAHDLSWGSLGHPWEGTICVFGQPLLDVIEANPPRLFHQVIRRKGWGSTS